MSPRDFVYWLQGYFEIHGGDKLNKKQVQIIKDHLQLVFDKETPDRTEPQPLVPMPYPPVPTIPSDPIDDNKEWVKERKKEEWPEQYRITCVDGTERYCAKASDVNFNQDEIVKVEYKGFVSNAPEEIYKVEFPEDFNRSC